MKYSVSEKWEIQYIMPTCNIYPHNNNVVIKAIAVNSAAIKLYAKLAVKLLHKV